MATKLVTIIVFLAQLNQHSQSQHKIENNGKRLEIGIGMEVRSSLKFREMDPNAHYGTKEVVNV